MPELHAALITIGDELLIGQTIDTNSAYIARELNRIGIWVNRRIAIGDIREDILTTLAEQSRDCGLVIITGGLGPTADDITKPALCSYFGTELVMNEAVRNHVKWIFERLGKPLTARNEAQALVPATCTVLPNERGTAPGMWFEKEGVIYVSLPGVPHEMQGLMQTGVLPRLEALPGRPYVAHRTLLTAGIGESALADVLIPFEAALPATIKLAYLPSYGMVRLRLTSRTTAANEAQLDLLFNQLQSLAQPWLVANTDLSIEEAVGDLLKGSGRTLATAESCTGGYIAHRITAQAGASVYYKGSVVSYSNEVKEELLQVSPATLAATGAVSEETVTQMCQGVMEKLDTDYAIATSGIMGPGGGSTAKPVGTVWIAVGSRNEIRATRHQFRFDRSRNIELATATAFNLLRLLLLDESKAD